MKKHAYLIMAHNEFNMLKKLLAELDDVRNDIYLHIDKKVKNVDEKQFLACVRYSKIFFVKKRSIYWGTLSIVKCEIGMLEEATKGNYNYYHLVSGVDFPLKSQDYIHDYLDNKNLEFIEHYTDGDSGRFFMEKIKYYYPLLKYVGKADNEGPGFRKKIQRKLAYWQTNIKEFQEKHKVDRTKKYKDITFYKGNQWFSITHDFACFVLSMKRQVLKMYWLTDGADEFFIPTLAMNSGFADRVSNNSLRSIDWIRGTPYEYSLDDLTELEKSDAFFARKISYERNPDLVDGLVKYIHGC
ncbi:beta-1,6-N-acetylglucosaminyltransferase [Butyrivibrio sp. INlla16]|uniref:beta-1,6-N-acetylglucosaminyltransferase n=1 Tax=Butyrivibrio sp. INlla16 TaxID=1520807 RepID=UPI00088A58D9|nr:beta-1,6-N-acetylglucosaminyltransferase [Butyrivibrio sp. INlla16]SDB68548.1 Core-2/I-Branching enzyme [Butyrivibrio sp. INlla16]